MGRVGRFGGRSVSPRRGPPHARARLRAGSSPASGSSLRAGSSPASGSSLAGRVNLTPASEGLSRARQSRSLGVTDSTGGSRFAVLRVDFARVVSDLDVIPDRPGVATSRSLAGRVVARRVVARGRPSREWSPGEWSPRGVAARRVVARRVVARRVVAPASGRPASGRPGSGRPGEWSPRGVVARGRPSRRVAVPASGIRPAVVRRRPTPWLVGCAWCDTGRRRPATLTERRPAPANHRDA
jgi:hypothetical protein